jgi:hypothetical protein
VIIDTLVQEVTKSLGIPDAELARRLGTNRARLYQWKTYRRKMPTPYLYKLITMSGRNIQNTIGQYVIEWQRVRIYEGKAKEYPWITHRG